MISPPHFEARLHRCDALIWCGLVMALGTPRGLFRQYWAVVSLVLTILANVVLLVHIMYKPRGMTRYAWRKGKHSFRHKRWEGVWRDPASAVAAGSIADHIRMLM